MKKAYMSLLQTYPIILFCLIQCTYPIIGCQATKLITPQWGYFENNRILKLNQYKAYTHNQVPIPSNQQDFDALFIAPHYIAPHSSLSLGLGALASLLASVSAPVASIVLIAVTGALAYTSITGRKVIPERIWRLLGGQHCHVQWNLNDISPVILEEINKSQKPKTPSGKNLIYEPAAYHKEVPLIFLSVYLSQHTTGIKSPCPPKAEGQMILDFLSFPVGPKHRMAYVGGAIIYFSFTQEVPQGTLYHGHYHVHPVHQLKKPFLDALLEQGIINGKGRFLK